MEKKTNYGKIIAITLAIVAGVTAIAFVLYKFFIKDLAKCYCCEECEDDFLDDCDCDCECECISDEPEVTE